MLHIFVSINGSYPGVSHHDVSIVWHNRYYQYACFGDNKEGTYGNLDQLLELRVGKKYRDWHLLSQELILSLWSHW